MLRYTAIGLRMRAVVESPRLTELAGVNSDRVSMASWMLSSSLAGIAGVLLTPVFAGQVDYLSYQALVIAAIAAAVIGGLGSIPLAYAGGLDARRLPAAAVPVPADQQHHRELR